MYKIFVCFLHRVTALSGKLEVAEDDSREIDALSVTPLEADITRREHAYTGMDSSSARLTIYQCPVCQTMIGSLASLKLHLAGHVRRAGAECHKCHICGKKFTQHVVLMKHVKAIHLGMIPTLIPQQISTHFS